MIKKKSSYSPAHLQMLKFGKMYFLNILPRMLKIMHNDSSDNGNSSLKNVTGDNNGKEKVILFSSLSSNVEIWKKCIF